MSCRFPLQSCRGGTIATATRLSDGALGGRGAMHPDKVAAMARQLEQSPMAQDLLAVSA